MEYKEFKEKEKIVIAELQDAAKGYSTVFHKYMKELGEGNEWVSTQNEYMSAVNRFQMAQDVWEVFQEYKPVI